MEKRFGARQDSEGWTVFRVLDGVPADIAGIVQMGLEFDDAEELADLLNYHERLDEEGKSHLVRG